MGHKYSCYKLKADKYVTNDRVKCHLGFDYPEKMQQNNQNTQMHCGSKDNFTMTIFHESDIWHKASDKQHHNWLLLYNIIQ